MFAKIKITITINIKKFKLNFSIIGLMVITTFCSCNTDLREELSTG
ncbi:hypothetical protein HNQ03_001916 [Chryseobacterium sp. 16F]|uniref:Uncharacterized protein n=1 Tax=Frigoriflavimonas asaccharolytica TaxID=2735899 RepID=A0A8J8K8P8_9FLAO|nr:hypothetical protein [Frigoriflavimonas asaccharolytica]